MTRNSPRSTRRLVWRCLRWALVIPALPLVWWACISHPLTQPTPTPEQQTNIYIDVSPKRILDLVFMIDNSPSMTPKQEKLKAQFPKLIAALVDPVNGQLPDLHVAIIDSDLGTAGAYTSGTCGPNAANNMSLFGDKGKFQMRNAKDCGVTDANAMFLAYENGKPQNFTGDINKVFTCLASGLGTAGCGQEHQLQAFEWALIDLGSEVGNGPQIQAFLRPMAYLGLVFLTDEDDCSAAINDGMFGPKPGGIDLSMESASLRCSTRAHQCGGQNLNGAPPLPNYPTKNKYQHAFAECKARTDSCSNPTNLTAPDKRAGTDTANPDLNCSPLKDVKLLADEIKSLKDEADKILVAGIFGWQREGEKPLDYRIDFIPNPGYTEGTTAPKEIYEYWPVCYDPKFKPNGDAYNAEAFGNGAMGGLRNSAFIDEFGTNGLKFSICEPDYTKAMEKIGKAIAAKLQVLCVDYKLLDTMPDDPADPTSLGVQADCRVAYRFPVIDPKTNKVSNWKEDPGSLPKCPSDAKPENIDTACWQILNDDGKCSKNGQYINVMRTKAEMDQGPLEAGTKAGMQCRTCGDPVPGLNPKSAQAKQCNYCATDKDCCPYRDKDGKYDEAACKNYLFPRCDTTAKRCTSACGSNADCTNPAMPTCAGGMCTDCSSDADCEDRNKDLMDGLTRCNEARSCDAPTK